MKYLKLFEIKKTENPFIQAAKRGSSAKVKEFIKGGATIDSRDNSEHRTALMWASINSFLMVVDVLIKAGADVNLTDKDNRTALMMASTVTISDKLLEAGTDVNIQNNRGDNVLMECMAYGGTWNTEKLPVFMNKLLKYGLNLHTKNNQGLTFYDKLRIEKEQTRNENRQEWLDEMIKYMDIHHPECKQEWELKDAMNKYNL